MNWTQSPRTLRWSLVILATLSAAFFIAAAGAEDNTPPAPIDWNKAQEIYRKAQSGQQLTPEERAYLERAKAERAKNNPTGNPGAGATSRPAGKPSVGLKPLTEMSAEDRYKEQDGGLYGQGKNEPPEAHLAAALAAAKLIQPLDDQGKPAADGAVVLISLGMSNTTQEFSRFVQLAGQDKALSPKIKIVDGAQGGMDAAVWLIKPGNPGANPGAGAAANPGARPGGPQPQRPRPWDVLDQRLKAAGVTAAQVQAAWLKQALIQPARLGEFPAHAKTLQDDEAQIVREMKKRFPNLRLVYLSSRIYAGWAGTQLNPEPYAYESAFSVRGLIQDQMVGKKELNYDPAKGEVVAPLLLWGPYLWADGTTGRKTDGLKFERVDLGPDGTHPSDSGRKKVAELLLQFFKTDPTAKGWFCAETAGK